MYVIKLSRRLEYHTGFYLERHVALRRIKLQVMLCEAVHTDPGELKNMQNSITLKFMQRYDSI